MRFAHRIGAALLCATLLCSFNLARAAEPSGKPRAILPPETPVFAGKIGKTPAESEAAFPPVLRAPEGAPNVLLVMTDDVGFAASSTFGGLIPTPSLDRLAAAGLRYNNFHTTAMCSPSRAALLTGRNHHAVGMGALTDFASGYPGYFGEISKSAATVGEILKQNGYSTAFFGKHHNTPVSQVSPAGPFQNWPVGLGFDYFYGFLGSQTDQWTPALYRGTSRVDVPKGEHLDHLLVEDAVAWLHNQKAAVPDKPFFIYLAPGSAHAPLQAPKEWIAKFKGKFDQGWDRARAEIYERQKAEGIIPKDAVLTPRPGFVADWETLTADQKRVASRFMEVYAAQLAYQDHEFGRLIAELARMGQLDNTLVIFVEGDNGASSEGGRLGTDNDTGALVNQPKESDAWLLSRIDDFGGPNSHSHYPMGWAWAMNTPFQYFKRFASHLGGMTNGMVISWPGHITDVGAVRPQFQHLNDVVPTILSAAKIPGPEVVNGVKQRPMDGADMSDTFASADAPGRHHVQYFELLGNRSIYQDGWMASTTPPESAFVMTVHEKSTSPLDFKWELYDLKADFSQSHDLASENPQKLKAMEALWWSEAKKNQVLPIDNTLGAARVSAETRAHVPVHAHYDYWGDSVELERGVAPPILARSFTLTAHVTIPAGKGSGVLAAVGDEFGGWSFYLRNGRPVAYQAFSEQASDRHAVRAQQVVAPGDATISYDVRYLKGSRAADVSIKVDGRVVATGQFPNHINMVDQGEAFTIGRDSRAPVSPDYSGEGKFNGEIHKVEIDFPDLAAPQAPAAKP